MSKATKIAISLMLVAVIALSFAGGYTLAGRIPAGDDDLTTVKQVWDIIASDYVDKDKIDARALKQAAIEGMIATLDDPYTSYLEAQDYQLGMSRLEGEFDGIGAYVGVRDGQLTIIAPIPGSPAAEAGIRAGDIILEIDGVATDNLSLAEAVLKIRGAHGTSVRLLILHEGEPEPEEIEIIRGKIEVPSVRFEMKEDIAYINIIQFSGRTDGELLTVLNEATEAEAEGIILDLRSNPGGLLEIVINITGYFLPEGVAVKVVSNQDEITTHQINPSDLIVSLPMVVLVDEFSASGSEVLAGALQDHDRALIAGTTTFGKGSVNILRQLDDGSGLYITTARWLTPGGRRIEGNGIDPDHELELEGDEAIQWAIDYLQNNS